VSKIENEILEMIARSLEVHNGKITMDSCMDNVEEWDSLGHLSILVSLDKKFNGKLAGIKKMSTANSIKAIFKILKNNHFI
jgi:acyl carrier protein